MRETMDLISSLNRVGMYRQRRAESTRGYMSAREPLLMIIIPTGTDAPIYHWPYATVGLIVRQRRAPLSGPAGVERAGSG